MVYVDGVMFTAQSNNLDRELGALIELGITPPQLPPKRVTTPAPEVPDRKSSRHHSFQGNYADLHHGRPQRPRK